MDVERAKKILEKSGVTKQYFASLLGVKPITVRLAFSNKRLSKKMVALLEDMGRIEQKEEEEKSERALVKEGMIKQSMDEGTHCEGLPATQESIFTIY